MPRSILDLSQQEFTTWLAERGQAAYRAGQICQWLFQGRAASFDQMSNLPKALRTQLTEAFSIFTATVVKHSQADDGTEKLLLELTDRGRIECVLIRDGDRRSICISTPPTLTRRSRSGVASGRARAAIQLLRTVASRSSK